MNNPGGYPPPNVPMDEYPQLDDSEQQDHYRISSSAPSGFIYMPHQEVLPRERYASNNQNVCWSPGPDINFYNPHTPNSFENSAEYQNNLQFPAYQSQQFLPSSDRPRSCTYPAGHTQMGSYDAYSSTSQPGAYITSYTSGQPTMWKDHFGAGNSPSSAHDIETVDPMTVSGPFSPRTEPTAGERADFTDEEATSKEEPYAQLIFKALKDAPGHQMILRDIYDWFQTNTDKAVDPVSKGWQNSIRHNLSMNGAFQKVENPESNNGDSSKKGFLWRLSEEALSDGVKSTTRYRPKPSKSRRVAAQLKKSRRSRQLNDRGSPYSMPSSPADSTTYDGHRIQLGLAPRHQEYADRLALNRSTPYFVQNAEEDTWGQTLPIDYKPEPIPYAVPNCDRMALSSNLASQRAPPTPPIFPFELSNPGTPDLDPGRVEAYNLQYYKPLQPIFYNQGSEAGDEPTTPPSSDVHALIVRHADPMTMRNDPYDGFDAGTDEYMN